MTTESTVTQKKGDMRSGSRYLEAVGRRKTAIARVRMKEAGKMTVSVNGRDYGIYFPTQELQTIVKDPFVKSESGLKFAVEAKVMGGGIHAQAEALRHGITRALVLHNQELRKTLKRFGFLKRDPRVKERKKFGLKKARRAPQWSKR